MTIAAPPAFEPADAGYQRRTRESFAKQGAMAHLGAVLERVQPGLVEISLPYRDELSQQHGFFQAGIIGAIVDNAGGYAGFTLMPPDTAVLTVEYKLNLLAPGDGDLLIATGEVLKPGRNLVITRGEVYVEKDGRTTHCASMQQTLMTMHGKSDTEGLGK